MNFIRDTIATYFSMWYTTWPPEYNKKPFIFPVAGGGGDTWNTEIYRRPSWNTLVMIIRMVIATCLVKVNLSKENITAYIRFVKDSTRLSYKYHSKIMAFKRGKQITVFQVHGSVHHKQCVLSPTWWHCFYLVLFTYALHVSGINHPSSGATTANWSGWYNNLWVLCPVGC
jgi:hypothetical protein